MPEGERAQIEASVTGTARKMSLTQATMLVAGNMIGTGVFLLPVNLAAGVAHLRFFSFPLRHCT